MKKQQPISTDSDWNFALLEQYETAIGKAAAAHGLDTFPNQIELISSEQMMDAYASVGLPIYYHHWSFGKRFIHTDRKSTRLNSSHITISYAVFCLKKKCMYVCMYVCMFVFF